MSSSSEIFTIGWREWISIPAIGVNSIIAKVDTGAKTSAIHAFDLEYFQKSGVEHVRFKVHPFEKRSHDVITAESPLTCKRIVKTSGGHTSLRPVIATKLHLGGHSIFIELTLTSRSEMEFCMLLGRNAIRNKFLVDPSSSFLLGKKS